MAADGSRLETQVAGMVLIHESMDILTLLDAPGESKCTQVFVERDLLFAEMRDSETELEPEPPMIPFPPMPNKLRALALTKQKHFYSCEQRLQLFKRTKWGLSFIRLEIASSARQSTLNEFFK